MNAATESRRAASGLWQGIPVWVVRSHNNVSALDFYNNGANKNCDKTQNKNHSPALCLFAWYGK